MTSIPRPVVRVAELMSTFRPWWALCGGWAVDAWIGEQTRDHVDIDIATFADDQRAVFEQLSGWNLIAHDAIVESGDDRTLGRPASRPAGARARALGRRRRLRDAPRPARSRRAHVATRLDLAPLSRPPVAGTAVGPGPGPGPALGRAP